MDTRSSLEEATGKLFGDLWGPYDQQLFEESVELFTRRLDLAGFDKGWFKGKRCLDAGCGGGRNSIAMARLGADEVVGIDVGEKGLLNALRRSDGTSNVRFEYGSILDIPFEDEAFDLVWCAGVVMTTADEERALDELCRVTRSGGYLYLLIYATGGLRWPLVQLLRPLTAQIGQAAVEDAMALAGLPANKRRTFLDDLFCPRLDFYHWGRLEGMLDARGFHRTERWGPECRLDHEANLESYRLDLEALLDLFRAGDDEQFGSRRGLFRACLQAAESVSAAIRWFQMAVERADLTAHQAMERVIGQGHHRVLAVKG